MGTEKDIQDPNTSVPQDEAIASETGGRARIPDPQEEPAPNTSVPQDDK